MMPKSLVLVRHGESEGNVAAGLSKKGDHSLFDGKFRDRHSSQWRLSTLGIQQAERAGWYLREVLGYKFDRFYCSDYVRAKETAAHLGLEDACWRKSFYLRERDWGDLDLMSWADRQNFFAESMRRRKHSALYWAPPNGKSMADLCGDQIYRMNDTLHRECEEKEVVIVSHGEVMWGFDIVLSHLFDADYQRLELSEDPRDKIHNCQIIEYSRIDPFTGFDQLKYKWRRSSCPWDLSLSHSEWRPINYHQPTNQELLAEVATIERCIDC